jgi:RNA-directed DNA polymerase
MKEMLTVEMRIAERARKYPAEALTNLHEMMDVRLLEGPALHPLTKREQAA